MFAQTHNKLQNIGSDIPDSVVRIASVLGFAGVFLAVSGLGGLEVAAQNAPNTWQFCGNANIGGSGFVTIVKNFLTIVVFAALIFGTVGVILGFAANAIPFIDMSEAKKHQKNGLVYGWGILLVLYGLYIVNVILALDVGCLFPIV